MSGIRLSFAYGILTCPGSSRFNMFSMSAWYKLLLNRQVPCILSTFIKPVKRGMAHDYT